MAETKTKPEEVTEDAPLLNLSDEFDRPKVILFGETYEMRSPEELSFEMMRSIQRGERRIQKLYAKLEADDLAEKEEDEVYVDLDKMTVSVVEDCMVGVPVEVIERLKLGQRQQIPATFLKLARNANLTSDST